MSFVPFESFGCWDVMLLHAAGADPMGFIASRTGLFLKDSCKLLYIYKYKISHLGWGLVIGELKAFAALVHVTLLHVSWRTLVCSDCHIFHKPISPLYVGSRVVCLCKVCLFSGNVVMKAAPFVFLQSSEGRD